MTELLTPEQIDSIKRQQRAWNSEFQVRGDAPKLCLQDFCAMHANVTRLLRDREAICERLDQCLLKARRYPGCIVVSESIEELLSELRGDE